MVKTTQSPITPILGSIDDLEAIYKANISKSSSKNQNYILVIKFLLCYKGIPDTFSSYRRELEKLMLWLIFIRKCSVLKLTTKDAEDFIIFCQNPPKKWITDKVYKRFIKPKGTNTSVANPKWRPFVSKTPSKYEPSSAVIRSLFAILGSFFSYLVNEDYIEKNPVSMIRQKGKFLVKKDQQIVRKLTDKQKIYVIDAVKKLAKSDPESHERSLFIIKCLLSMYLRISELTKTYRYNPKMNDFHKDSDGNWWFFTIGKRNKERYVTVSDEMLASLKRYRTFLGLTPLPLSDDETPLITPLRGRGNISSTRQIRRIVQLCFDTACNELMRKGFTEESIELKNATVHWLRHTGISQDVKTRPLAHVQADAGHDNISTTGRYIDVLMKERHKSGKDKII
jgi:site-specific recombinase XerD